MKVLNIIDKFNGNPQLNTLSIPLVLHVYYFKWDEYLQKGISLL